VIYPFTEVHDQIGFTMLIVAWTLTEIIRYLSYTFTLMRINSAMLLWLRYSLFIVLYPLGVAGEFLTIYHSLQLARESGLYFISLPNVLNFSIDYFILLIGTIPLYVILCPQLYIYMLAQRQKQLCIQPSSNCEKHSKFSAFNIKEFWSALNIFLTKNACVQQPTFDN